MSARDWKPGDVAIWKRRAARPELLFRYLGGVDYDEPEWQTAHDGAAYPQEGDLHPVVVIDPEDAEHVEQLVRALSLHAPTWPKYMQNALRSLIPPRKPKEPTGLGAVVEDSSGCRWTRLRDQERPAGSACWQRATSGVTITGWLGVDAVKVLSEGVTS